MKWIEVKMRELGVTNNPNYKIAFFVDHMAMISVHTEKYGNVNVSHLCCCCCLDDFTTQIDVSFPGQTTGCHLGHFQGVHATEYNHVR